jgi:hypothetical protein
VVSTRSWAAWNFTFSRWSDYAILDYELSSIGMGYSAKPYVDMSNSTFIKYSTLSFAYIGFIRKPSLYFHPSTYTLYQLICAGIFELHRLDDLTQYPWIRSGDRCCESQHCCVVDFWWFVVYCNGWNKSLLENYSPFRSIKQKKTASKYAVS